MELILKILTGERKNQTIVLQELTIMQNIKVMPYVLETEAFSLHIKLEEPCSDVVLLMDGIDYHFFNKGIINELFHYTLMPKFKQTKGYEALFYNYFGIANLEISITLNHQIKIIPFDSIEVLARKITAEQATYMVEYILRESSGDLYSCFSATRLKSGYIEGGEQPQAIFSKLIKVIKRLEDILPHIINRPLMRVSRKTRMQNGYQTKEVDEQGLAWLNENLSVLEETDDLERAHVLYDGTYYLAREMQTSVIIEHTDIYENRILYGFLQRLKSFAIEIEDKLFNIHRKSENYNEDGYVSFFSAMGSWIKHSSQLEINKVLECNERITRLMHLFVERIPVSIVEKGLPVLTHKVKSNRFYASIFRTMVEWYQFNKIVDADYDIDLGHAGSTAGFAADLVALLGAEIDGQGAINSDYIATEDVTITINANSNTVPVTVEITLLTLKLVTA